MFIFADGGGRGVKNLVIFCGRHKWMAPKSKYFFLADFSNDLDKLNMLKSQKEKTKEKKTNVYNKVSELYNEMLRMRCLDAKRSKIEYSEWYK